MHVTRYKGILVQHIPLYLVILCMCFYAVFRMFTLENIQNSVGPKWRHHCHMCQNITQVHFHVKGNVKSVLSYCF